MKLKIIKKDFKEVMTKQRKTVKRDTSGRPYQIVDENGRVLALKATKAQADYILERLQKREDQYAKSLEAQK